MDSRVTQKIEAFLLPAKNMFIAIRHLVYEVALQEIIGPIIEDIKWGEPSYASATGSPIRMNWTPKKPDQLSLFFNCNTILIETIKEVFGDTFTYIGKREITLPLTQPIPESALRDVVKMALKYHKVKKLPLLGA